MAWKKAVFPPPPKDKIVVETKIIKKGEKPRKVKTLNGKIQEVYDSEKGAWEKYDPNPVKSEPTMVPQEVSTPQKIEQDQAQQPEIPLVTETTDQTKQETQSVPDQTQAISDHAQVPEASTNQTPQEEPSEFDKFDKMTDADFYKEMGSLPENSFEKMMKKKGFTSFEKGALRGRRNKLRDKPLEQIEKVESTEKAEKVETINAPNIPKIEPIIPKLDLQKESAKELDSDVTKVTKETTKEVDETKVDLPQVPPTGTLPQVPPTGTLPQVPPTGTLPQVSPTGTLPQVSPTGTLPQVSPTGTLPQVSPTGTLPQVSPTGTLPQVSTIGTLSESKQEMLENPDAIDSHISKTEPTEPIISNTEPPNTVIKEDTKKAQGVQEMPIPGISNLSDRLNKSIDEIKDGVKPDIDMVKTSNEPQKAEIPKDVPKAEVSQGIPKEEALKIKSKEKKPIKEAKRTMADDETIQPSDERKFEEWLKKHKFQENVEKMTELAAENQEEIEGISTEITNVKGEIGSVKGEIGDVKGDIGGVKEDIGGVKGDLKGLEDRLHERLGPMKRPVSEALGEICDGVDCIKGDIKRSQESQQMLESKMNQRFEQLSEKLKTFEEPTFVCDNCGADGIKPLSSFCPNCGSPIHSWSDETGQPVKGWVPYWRRFPEKT